MGQATGTRVLVATRLSPEERSAIARLARNNDRPLSREIRRAILRHLEHEGASVPDTRAERG